MKADAVFVHQRLGRAVLRVTRDDFYAIQTGRRSDLRLNDQITGDLARNKAPWFFNVSRGTLIHVTVLGRFKTLESAVGAAA